MGEITPFAGLEVLAPAEPLSTDSFRFQFINPVILDRLTKIGAITHKHDGVVGLKDPLLEPKLETSESGGSIPANREIHVCYSWVDVDGGETLPSPIAHITTKGGFGEVQEVPTAEVKYTAGSLLAANYSYALTITDGLGGETELGPEITVTVEAGNKNAEVVVGELKKIMEAVSKGASGAGWRLWRQQNGGAWNLLTTGTTETVTDNGTLAVDCNVSPPAESTIHATNKFTFKVPDPEEERVSFFRVYISEEASFTSPSLLEEYPKSKTEEAISVLSLNTKTGQPQLRSTSYAHAEKIDPDKDMLAWPFKKSVTKSSELPTEGNEDGDIREATETHKLYIWHGSGKEWKALEGGGGGSGNLTVENEAGAIVGEEPRLQFKGPVKVENEGSHERVVVTVEAGTAIKWEKAWVSGTTYKAGDAVSRDGGSYLALVESKGVDPATDTGEAHWALIAAPGAEGGGGGGGISFHGEWSNSTTYAKEQAVYRQGGSYVSLIESNKGNDPLTHPEDWGLLAEAGKGFVYRGKWSGSTTYHELDVVNVEGIAYIAKNENIAVNPPEDVTEAHWEVLVRGTEGKAGAAGKEGEKGATGRAGLRWRGTWTSGATYEEHDAVYQTGTSYIAKTESKGVSPATDTLEEHWEKLAVKGEAGANGLPGVNWRGAWKNTTAYEVNDAVSRNGSSFIATVGSTGSDPVGNNTIVNGGAETSEMTHIKGHNSGTVERSKEEHALNGQWSFKVKGTATNFSGFQFEGLSWKTGEEVRATASIYGTAGETYRIALTATGYAESEVVAASTGVLASTGWNFVEVTMKAASTITSTGMLAIDQGEHATAYTWWVDEVKMAVGSPWDLLAAGASVSTGVGEPVGLVESHTFAVMGVLETGKVPPFFVALGEGEAGQRVVKIEYAIESGTSATFKVLHNGSAVEGLKEVKAESGAKSKNMRAKSKKEEEEGNLPPLVLKEDDSLGIEVSAIGGEPKGLSVTLFIEHMVDLGQGPPGPTGATGATGATGPEGKEGKEGKGGGGSDAYIEDEFTESLDLKNYEFLEGEESFLKIAGGYVEPNGEHSPWPVLLRKTVEPVNFYATQRIRLGPSKNWNALMYAKYVSGGSAYLVFNWNDNSGSGKVQLSVGAFYSGASHTLITNEGSYSPEEGADFWVTAFCAQDWVGIEFGLIDPRMGIAPLFSYQEKLGAGSADLGSGIAGKIGFRVPVSVLTLDSKVGDFIVTKGI